MFKTIKNFYVKNKWISRIGIVSLIISLSYVIIYDMPDYFGIEPIYAFLNNVSISYIAALIFFVVQVYISDERNKKSSMQILSNEFTKLIEFVEVAILLCEKYIEVKDKGVNIHWNAETETIYFKYKKSSAKSYTLQKYSKNELQNLKSEFNKILRNIKEMPVIQYCDYEILEKLTEIEKNNLFQTLENVVRLANAELSFNGFHNNIKDMKSLINEFKMLCSFTDIYCVEEVEAGERAITDMIRNNPISSLSSLDNINKAIHRENLREQINAILPTGKISEEDLDFVCNQIYKKKE